MVLCPDPGLDRWSALLIRQRCAQVRRGRHLVHDTLLQIQNAGAAIRRPLKVHFIGEEGVDEGGVQKVRGSLPPPRLAGLEGGREEGREEGRKEGGRDCRFSSHTGLVRAGCSAPS